MYSTKYGGSVGFMSTQKFLLKRANHSAYVGLGTIDDICLGGYWVGSAWAVSLAVWGQEIKNPGGLGQGCCWVLLGAAGSDVEAVL